MDAPDKIYIEVTLDGKRYYRDVVKEQRTENSDVEYIRTDVFIKKVSGWLKDCATFTDMNGKKRIDKEMYKATVEDFKKAMRQ